MKKLLFFISCFAVAFSYSQQQNVFSNFMMADYFFNPAIAGSRKVDVLSLNYHHQWVGFKRAPINIAANFSGSIKNKAVHGYGVTFLNSSSGLVNRTGIYANYAYHLRITDSMKIGFGIQPGFISFRTKLYDATIVDQGDPVLSGDLYNGNAFDLNFGVHLYSNKFFFMFTVEHLFTNVIKFTTYNQNLHYHFSALGGYTFKFKKVPYLTFKPAILLKYTKPAPLQFAVFTKFTFYDKYSFGLMYRDRDAFGINAEIKLFDRLVINYGYEFGINKLRPHNKGSHEVGLSFVITKKKKSLDEQDEKLNKSILDDMNKKSKRKKK